MQCSLSACRWSELVMAEFFKQGDLERSLGLPISPQMDRAATSVPMAQVNFIDFIVAPLYSQVWHCLGWCLGGGTDISFAAGP